jgi:hypothetical protein
MSESTNQIVASFRGVGEAVGRAMAPVIEELRRTGERMSEPESTRDNPPTSGL